MSVSKSSMHVIVTGGKNGIGEAVVSMASMLKCKSISVLDVEYDNTQNREEPVPIEYYPCDIRIAGSVASTIRQIITKERKDDLFGLVSNAGVYLPRPFLEQTEDDMRFVLETNLLGTLFVAQAFLRRLKEIQTYKKHRVVIIGSISCFYPGGENMLTYDASKAALVQVVKDLSSYSDLIDVNMVCPGTVMETGIGGWNTRMMPDEHAKEIVNASQMADVARGFGVNKIELAAMVCDMLFRWPSSVTGTMLVMDEGMTCMARR